MQQKTVVVDKVASIAQACGLGHELRIATTDIPCEEGVVLVVEVLNNKSTYNTLELTSGRMAKVSRATSSSARSAIARRCSAIRATSREGQGRRHPPGAEHRRRARHLRLGEPRQGQAVRLRACSAACCSSRTSASASACRRASATSALDYDATLDTHGVPVVALAGTCMEAGKTAAACAIVSRMRHRGLNVHAFKATGVSLRRDILAMEDAGARRSHDLHRLRRRDDDRGHRPGAHAHDADRNDAGPAGRHRVRARRRHPRRLWRRGDPRRAGHRQVADRR